MQKNLNTFPQISIVSSSLDSVFISQPNVSLSIPSYSFLHYRRGIIAIDSKGQTVDVSVLTTQTLKMSVILPQGFTATAIHEGIVINNAAQSKITLNQSTTDQNVALLQQLVANNTQTVIPLGMMANDALGSPMYLAGRSSQTSVLDDIAELYTVDQKTGQYIFGTPQSQVIFQQPLFYQSANNWFANAQMPITPSIHTLIPITQSGAPRLLNANYGIKVITFDGAPIQSNVQLIGFVQYYTSTGVALNTIFLYAPFYDINLFGVSSLDSNLVFDYATKLHITVPRLFMNWVLDCCKVALSDSLAQLITVTSQQNNAKNMAAAYLSGNKLLYNMSLQGLIDDYMVTVCNGPTWAAHPLCSCFNKEVLPCLSTTCQQKGYKSKTIMNANCADTLKGINLSYQDCSVYQNLQAGGNITIDNSVMASCQQIIQAQPTATQASSNAQTTLIKQPAIDSNAAQTPPKVTAPLPQSTGIQVSTLLYCFAGFVALVVCVIVIIIIRRKRTNTQQVQPLTVSNQIESINRSLTI